jgi:protein TonB
MIAKKSFSADLERFHYLFLSFGLVVSMSLVIVAFEWKFYDDGSLVKLDGTNDSFEELLDIPITEQPPPPPPTKSEFIELTEIPDEEVIDQEINFKIDMEFSEEMLVEQMDFKAEEVFEDEAEEIFVIVEKPPAPDGGYEKFYEFIYSEIKYPRGALLNRVAGKVFVQFVVNKEGELAEFQIAKGVGFGCDEEAIRVLKKSPNWVAGKQRGIPVNVRMILPIYFEIR